MPREAPERGLFKIKHTKQLSDRVCASVCDSFLTETPDAVPGFLLRNPVYAMCLYVSKEKLKELFPQASLVLNVYGTDSFELVIVVGQEVERVQDALEKFDAWWYTEVTRTLDEFLYQICPVESRRAANLGRMTGKNDFLFS